MHMCRHPLASYWHGHGVRCRPLQYFGWKHCCFVSLHKLVMTKTCSPFVIKHEACYQGDIHALADFVVQWRGTNRSRCSMQHACSMTNGNESRIRWTPELLSQSLEQFFKAAICLCSCHLQCLPHCVRQNRVCICILHMGHVTHSYCLSMV